MKITPEFSKKIKPLLVALGRVSKKILRRVARSIYKLIKWSVRTIIRIKRALHIIYSHIVDLTGEWLYHYGSQLLENDIKLDNNLKNKKNNLRIESYAIENDHSLVWSYSEPDDIISFIGGWIDAQLQSKWIWIQNTVSNISSELAAVAEYQLFMYRKIKEKPTHTTARVYSNVQHNDPVNAISFTEAIRLKIMDKLHAISTAFSQFVIHPIINKLGLFPLFATSHSVSPNYITYYSQRE